MNVALPFPLHRLHSVKALEISTPYKKKASVLDPTQAIRSDELTKLHLHRTACGSAYTHSQTLSAAGVGFNTECCSDQPPPPLYCLSVCHLFISLNIPCSCTVVQNKNSQLPAPPFVSRFFSFLLLFCHTVSTLIFLLPYAMSPGRWSQLKCVWFWFRTLPLWSPPYF